MKSIFLSPGDIHTKGMLFLLHLGLEDITEVNTDPKGKFVSFNPIQDEGGAGGKKSPVPVFPL